MPNDTRPPVPEEIKRELRRSAYWGCVFCGNPIIEYHHIQPWSIVKKHERDNLVVLCDCCHRRVHAGEINLDILRFCILSPFNKRYSYTKCGIAMGLYEKTRYSIGSNIFVRIPILIRYENTPLISIEKDENEFSVFNAVFYDQCGNLFAQISRNEWTIFIDREYWDVKYTPGRLLIKNDRKNMLLYMETINDIIYIETKMYYNGAFIHFGSDTFSLSTSSVRQLDIHGLTFSDGPYGVSIYKDGSIMLSSENGKMGNYIP